MEVGHEELESPNLDDQKQGGEKTGTRVEQVMRKEMHSFLVMLSLAFNPLRH